MLQPGTVLDNKYKIEAVIGRGGFGYVYRARERLTGETVAIKELIPSYVDDHQMVDRFVQEARLTLRLSNPHIVRTYGIFQDQGTYYLAMEFLPGGSLANRLERGPLSTAEAIRVATELCEALEEAHQRGIVHCDIKPANVLFDDQGQVHLTDFGIAHVSAELMSRKFFTTTGTALGTVRYMSPEQLAGVRADPRIDIYAVGAVLYEMLAGRPYLDFETDGTPRAQARNIVKIEKDPPRPLHAANRAVPDWLARVVEKTLKKSPQARFGTVKQLRDALRRESQNEPVPPVRPRSSRESWVTEVVDWLRDLPVAATVIGALAIIAVLACSALGVWYAIGFAPASDETPTLTLPPTHSATPPPLISPTSSPTDGATATHDLTETALPTATPTETPLPDRDGDEVPDSADRCPGESGPPELAGCPDSDEDGIPDPDDQCPSSVGPVDNTGCPIPETTVPPPTDTQVPEPTEPPPTDTPLPAAPPVDASLGDTWTRPADGMVMVYVPAGQFEMGSTQGEIDEKPVHNVSLSSFWIDRYEITNSAFQRFVQQTGYRTDAERHGSGSIWQNGQWHEVDGLDWRHPEDPAREISESADHPVVQVSWNDARAYCVWAGARLPTEAEWEMAAVDAKGWRYPWGDQLDHARLNAGGGGTTSVGSYPSGGSPCGAQDLAGNVWEWVSDWYSSEYYSTSPLMNPRGPSKGTRRALRGGGWDPSGGDSRSADRGALLPSSCGNTVGFRCAGGSE